MKTNEDLEKALMQVAESQIKHFIEGLQSLEVGDLKSLEEQVRSTINTMGCLMMEITLSTKTQEPTPASQQEGSCGRAMRLVGIRGKRLQTLMGPVTFWRPYYHCAGTKMGEEETTAASPHAAHGEAAADELFGDVDPAPLPERANDDIARQKQASVWLLLECAMRKLRIACPENERGFHLGTQFLTQRLAYIDLGQHTESLGLESLLH